MTTSSTSGAIYAAVLVLGVSAVVAAQAPASVLPQVPGAPPQAQAVDRTQPLILLNEAKQALDALPEAAADPRALADLRRDFATLQAVYLAQTASSSGTGLRGSSSTGITTGASTGALGTAGAAVSQPVGTAGSLQPPVAADWRTHYAIVDSDIAALAAAGNANTRSDALRASLEEVRSRLEKFFTSTLGQAAAPQASTNAPPTSPLPAPSSSQGETRANSEALVLLQRMEELLSSTDEKSDDLKEAGLVRIERAHVDEIKAEIAQLKAMLRN